MIPYPQVIMEKLQGTTPKEKHDNLIAMQTLLHQIAFPRRGTEEEHWNIYDISSKVSKLIKQHETYE